jgi:type VI secretion system FHA domain protein
MPLKVKVISYRGQPSVEILEAFFGRDGGTLGRSPEKRKNHLTLPDPEQFISRRHASITFENGLYYLTDTSVDGTYIQNKNMRVYRDIAVLADGDRIRIGDYELTVHISSSDTPEAVAHSSVYTNEGGASISSYDREKDGLGKPFGEESHAGENSVWWPDSDVFEETVEDNHTPEQAEGSPIHDPFTPPDIAEDQVQPREIPKNFNFEELISELDEPGDISGVSESGLVVKPFRATDRDVPGETFEEPPFNGKGDVSGANRKVPGSFVPTSGTSTEKSISPDSASIEQIRQKAYLELFQVFLEAAGVKDANTIKNDDVPELMQMLGTVFREMVDGLMAVLRGRSELKTQFRVPATILKPADNNPLKFYRIVDEALKQLLTKDQAGFADAMDAVREGFADIMNHQLAMTAGIQAAVIKLLERFDPQYFAKQYEEGVVFQRKAKSWDAYQQSYTEIANDALEDFFGESFAQAYEEQIRKLRPKTNES